MSIKIKGGNKTAGAGDSKESSKEKSKSTESGVSMAHLFSKYSHLMVYRLKQRQVLKNERRQAVEVCRSRLRVATKQQVLVIPKNHLKRNRRAQNPA